MLDDKREKPVVRPLGDRALTVAVPASDGGSGAGAAAVLAGRLRTMAADWIVDAVPAYETITVVYDPMRAVKLAARAGSRRPDGRLSPDRPVEQAIPYELAAAELTRLLDGLDATAEDAEPRTVEIPVCYGGAYGPDLADAAARSGMSERAFVDRHCAGIYTVTMIGFMPGFPYLSGLPDELAQPRRAAPRSLVPAGSVGIGGSQTGIYPLASPGGWQLIGRTPLRLFDPRRDEPSLLRAGDRLRFVPADERDWPEWSAKR